MPVVPFFLVLWYRQGIRYDRVSVYMVRWVYKVADDTRGSVMKGDLVLLEIMEPEVEGLAVRDFL